MGAGSSGDVEPAAWALRQALLAKILLGYRGVRVGGEDGVTRARRVLYRAIAVLQYSTVCTMLELNYITIHTVALYFSPF